MKPIPETEIASSIAAALDALAGAKEAVNAVLADVQASCEHRFVSEMPYRSSQYLSSRSAHRICNHCRLIEEGSHWSGGSVWSKHDHSTPDLGNVDGRVVLPVDSDAFYKMQVSA